MALDLHALAQGHLSDVGDGMEDQLPPPAFSETIGIGFSMLAGSWDFQTTLLHGLMKVGAWLI